MQFSGGYSVNQRLFSARDGSHDVVARVTYSKFEVTQLFRGIKYSN